LNLGHFRHLPGGSDEFVESARMGLIKGKAQTDLHLVPKLTPVYLCLNSPDHAIFTHPLQPPPQADRRHACPLGKFRIRNPGIGQKLAQNTAISDIRHDYFTFGTNMAWFSLYSQRNRKDCTEPNPDRC